jgi:hypothetical protein
MIAALVVGVYARQRTPRHAIVVLASIAWLVSALIAAGLLLMAATAANAANGDAVAGIAREGIVASGAPGEPATSASPVTLAVDRLGEAPGIPPAGDLLSMSLWRLDEGWFLRVSLLSLVIDEPALRASKAGSPPAAAGPISLRLTAVSTAGGGASTMLGAAVLERRDDLWRPRPGAKGQPGSQPLARPDDPDALWFPLPEELVAGRTAADPLELEVVTSLPDGHGDRLAGSLPPERDYQAHCALVLHGNQGLGYTEVLHGRGDDLDGSGFDEALQVHETYGVPGNFHLSGTLQTAAEWAANTGDPQDFNAWLAAGVAAGWAGMITSAYAQHIMPFVQNDMNDWAVHVETQMIDTRYGYFPTVAWVPERVWLNTSGYPSAGVNDWIGDNWLPHGVQAVILDDDVHLSGHDNHQIHVLAASDLRLVPRDRTFTGDIVGGNGQGALDILTGLADSGVGQYRIAVFAEDWEAVAEMGSWASATPYAKETYDWFIQKCAEESGWLHTWKLADAVANPDFTGDTITPTPGTYQEIGGFDGYGGGDNGWYTHWAGFVPYATGGDGSGNCAGTGGSCKDYGTLWNDAYNALMAAPDNNISQAGWYVLMTNLHETAWHDGLVGPISGWQHRYSAHVKNAAIYAEAARWADGQYAQTTGAFFADVDLDGYDECLLYNDRLLAVFEGIGGRATHLFVKDSSGEDTAIGIDNAYWSGTEGDYNDDNHVGAFSDVSPNYQHDGYDIQIVSAGGPTARLRLTHNEVSKEIALSAGDSYLNVVYRVGPATHWIQAGFSPSLVDLVWNAQMDRIWVADTAYMGRRDPNTGIAAAWVLAGAGASHQKEISGTLMKGDEIKGNGVFQCRLFAGRTTAPGPSGEIAELRVLASSLHDTIGPMVTAAVHYPAADRLQVELDQAVPPASVDVTGFGVDEDGDGLPEVTLGAGTTLLETTASFTLTFTLDAATAAALEALAGDPLLLVEAGAMQDESGNPNLALTPTGNIPVTVVDTQVTIDGRLESGEWGLGFCLSDSNDSAWTASNEIDGLQATWDSVYLYLAIDGVVSANSWLLYLDVDPDSGNGQTDLTAIDVWERGATFSAPGFAPDFQYGCYQHQSVYDSDGFWQLLSPTSTQDRSGEIVSAFDSQHLFGDAGGSEMAIPWNTLYGLGNDAVPPGARIALVASVCWDPEPDGVLGGDSAPSNLSAALPEIDSCWILEVDHNGDGQPDRLHLSAAPPPPLMTARLLPPVPNPFNPATTLAFELPGTGGKAVDLAVYDLRGRRVATLLHDVVPPGRHQVVWRGQDDAGRPVAAGTYFCRLRYRGRATVRALSLVK